MTSISAVVLSAYPYRRTFPGVDEVVVHQSRFNTPRGLLAARVSAVQRVKTSHWFFLDDDDDLPSDIASVLQECLDHDVSVAYTDELITMPGGSSTIRRSQPFERHRFFLDPQLIHHLALCRTSDTLEVLGGLPRGDYAPEILLYWTLAQRSSAYVPRVGYIWHRRGTGVSHWPETMLSQVRASLWCGAQ